MIDINNGIIKTVRSLANKHHRDEEGLFVAEGTKCVRDTWDAFTCRWLIGTRQWYDECGVASYIDKMVFATRQQMSRISQFDTPSQVLAVYEKPRHEFPAERVPGQLSVVLDNVQDPGNLGTIVRLADWFGIRDVFASIGTVDVYNHKVVQATMGAIGRVQVHYVDLESLFGQFPDLPVYGTVPSSTATTSTAPTYRARGSLCSATRGRASRPRWRPTPRIGYSSPKPPAVAARASTWAWRRPSCLPISTM